jgi:sulfide:quinone oxidoreductase
MARILILGAGFGGLELSTTLSEALGDAAEVTLIDRNDSFVFGYSKLDLMFRGASGESVRLPYAQFTKPGVRVLRETVTAIDPAAKRVTTDAGVHEADYLVIALGADYDLAATPGFAEVNSEFYSVAGAERLAGQIASFSAGRALIGVCGTPFKCPPAPSECALLLDEELSPRQRPRRRCAANSRRAGSSCSPAGGSPASIPSAASPSSTTTPKSPSTSSSACRCTAPPTS